MKQNQLASITYQTIRYLENTSCKIQSPEKIKDFLRAMEPFKLTKCEILTLLNVCPKTPLEIQLVIYLKYDIIYLKYIVKNVIKNYIYIFFRL